jgi:tryptophanyl-tRNA synthetase
MSEQPRLLTGDRPTGPLHLGHLVGSLQARVDLQDSHECFVIVADLHTLTTRPQREHIARLGANVRDVVLDLLAVGIDPARSTIYLQSGVPAVYDLDVLLQMLVPVARLERVPSIRGMATAAGISTEAMTLGLLAYPVLQAADILMARARVVPVGRDNEEHVHVARELAVAFNETYGDVFPVPEALLSKWPALPGVEAGLGGSRHKMSKSLGNAVFLSDSPETVREKLATLEAEPGTDAGRWPVFEFVDAFVGGEEATSLRTEFAAGALSRAALLDRLVRAVEGLLAPLRQRRAEYAGEPGRVEEVVVDGTIRAREVAYGTLQAAREAMGLEALWAGLVKATEARAQARKRPY